MPFFMRLSDWETSSRRGVLGRWLAGGGAYLSVIGGLVAGVYASYNDRTPFLLVVVVTIAPGVLVTAAGLLLVARSGTYRGPGRVRWWNWLTWRT